MFRYTWCIQVMIILFIGNLCSCVSLYISLYIWIDLNFLNVFHCQVYLCWMQGIWSRLCSHKKTPWHGYIFKLETILRTTIWTTRSTSTVSCHFMCLESLLFLYYLILIYVDVHILICAYFHVNLFDRQKRTHTHTTPTHTNMQTDKECAWARPN